MKTRDVRRNIKKIGLILLISLFIGCQTPKRVVVYKTDIPEFSCPVVYVPDFEKLEVSKKEEGNLLVRADNRATVKRVITNLINIIKCYEENIKIFRENKKTDKEVKK